MALKIGNAIMTQIKGERGLAHDMLAYLAREDITLIGPVVVATFGQPVTPGQETGLAVSLPGLRANSDVKEMRATLRVFAATEVAPVANTMSVKEGAGPARTFVVSAQRPAGLSNVSLRLDPGEVFWSHAGLLAPGDHVIPIDLAEQVNTYLDRTAHGDGAVTLKFMLKSDTPGRALIQIGAGDYQAALLQTQTWPNELDGTLRADRNLALDFNTVARLPLTAIAPLDGRATALTQIRIDVSGQFGPERLLESMPGPGAAEGPPPGEFGTVSGAYALARGFVLDPATVKGGAVLCAGFSAFVRVTEEAELYAELQVDAAPPQSPAGSPPAGPAGAGAALTGAASAPVAALTAPAAGAPLARCNQVIAPPPEAQGQPSERWVFVRWEAPAELQVGVPYWLVLKGIRGQVYLGLRSDDAGRAQDAASAGRAVRDERLRINRGGQLWKGLQRAGDDRVRARLALVYLPGPDNGVAAVSLGVEGAAAALVEPGAQPATVALDLAGADLSQAVLVVQSNAAGVFTVANVIQEYRAA